MRLWIAGTLGALIVVTAGGGAVHARTAGGRHVRATLVAETDAVRPGEPLVVGFHLQMEPGWHTYWRNPGDSGLPTRVRWELPEGFSAGELQWPRPIRFPTGPLVSYGYEHDVLLLVEIGVPSSVAADEIRLAAHLSWLECREACLPGKAELTLALPVRRSTSPGPTASLFAEARRRMPRREAGWRFSAEAGGEAIELTAAPPRGTSLSGAYFFPVTRRVVDYSQPQTLETATRGYRIRLARDPNGAPAVDRLAGVLVATTPTGVVALDVDIPMKTRSATRAATPTSITEEKNR